MVRVDDERKCAYFKLLIGDWGGVVALAVCQRGVVAC
jgi:hypothetical protein